MSYDLTVITPTGNRHEAFALCERWMARQTFDGSIQWLVLDNGAEPVDCTMGQELIKLPEDHETGKQSLASKISIAIEHVKAERITVCEDDDFYEPAHLADLMQRLERVVVAGTKQQRYYNLAYRKWRQYTNFGSCLCSTGLRAEALPMLASAAQKSYQTSCGLDRAFWEQAFKRVKCDCFYDACYFIGMKGLPGRPGLGVGHRPDHHWTDDPGFKKLCEWVGADAGHYMGFTTKTTRKHSMKVRAKQKMFVGGQIRQKGDEFDYDGDPGENMVAVEDVNEPAPTPEPPAPPQAKKKRGRRKAVKSEPTDGPVQPNTPATTMGKPRPFYEDLTD